MIKFDYKRAASIENCLELLHQYSGNAKLLAGGTDLMVDFRADDRKVQHVELVIDTTHIPALKFINEEGDSIRIGAGVTFQELWENSLLKIYAPFLCEAGYSVGSPQIRNAGTIGGSIGTASPASDPAPPMVAMDTMVNLKSLRGERSLLLSDFLIKPYKTALEPDEMIVSVSFKKLNPSGGFSFVKLGRRKTLAIARMNVAVYVELDENRKAVDVRIVPGASLPTAARVRKAEKMLLGKAPDYELHREIGLFVAGEMVKATGRRWSTAYKEPVIASLIKRALNQATGIKENE
ncbi:MAG: xanthine dehydrogenase family protein subunit M [Spirochaetales bacterium]|nr:xanthine dehydrogenase family protein subunit M [Spirochaetales bacterium]